MQQPAPTPSSKSARRQLVWATRGWFGATLLGQLLFATFILLYYYPPTISGGYSAWNNKPLITGYVAGDAAGNRQFALHVLAAAAMTLSGLIQLVPDIRTRWPLLHRWSGRLFLTLALVLATGGLWLVWVRGSYLTMIGALSISLDGVLIIAFGLMAWFHAHKASFARHRRWALRAFVVSSGVWFMRVGYVAWGITTGGAGIGKGMSGPFDLIWGFATYLLPLAVLELYLRAERGSPLAHFAMAAGLWLGALTILVGSVAAWMVMWWPYL